jgi:hypothetical protein
MYLQSIKSVKHNAAMSVDRSTLKKSRHIWLGDFIVHSSMVHADSYLVAALSYTYLTAIYYSSYCQDRFPLLCQLLWLYTFPESFPIFCNPYDMPKLSTCLKFLMSSNESLVLCPFTKGLSVLVVLSLRTVNLCGYKEEMFPQKVLTFHSGENM